MKKKIILRLIASIFYPVIMLILFPFALVETILEFTRNFLIDMAFNMKENYISNIKYLIERLKKFSENY